MAPVETQHGIVVRGKNPLPCPLADLHAAVFSLVEGFGDVAASGSDERGWHLDLTFDSPHCFTSVIDAVRQALTTLGYDLHSATVLVRGKRRRFVDVF
jgi:hypothetical protein